MNQPAPSLHAGSHLHQAVSAAPLAGRWRISPVGDRWAAIRPWAGEVYWMRYFDTFQLATDFVKSAVAKAAVVA